MRAGAWPLIGILGVWVGCTVTPGSADVLRPERESVVPAAVEPGPSTPDGGQTGAGAPGSEPTAEGGADAGFDLDGYKREQEEADGTSGKKRDLDALRAELGVTGEVPPAEAVAPPIPSVVPVGTARWTPMTPISLGWGLRLVSTVDAATPPRAILGLPDGREEVVKAGDLLPEVGVVVLAVGQGVVQIAQVTGDGDRARVESVFLQAMFPGTPAAPAVLAPAPAGAVGVRPR
jgi:hypothetical protein